MLATCVTFPAFSGLGATKAGLMAPCPCSPARTLFVGFSVGSIPTVESTSVSPAAFPPCSRPLPVRRRQTVPLSGLALVLLASLVPRLALSAPLQTEGWVCRQCALSRLPLGRSTVPRLPLPFPLPSWRSLCLEPFCGSRPKRPPMEVVSLGTPPRLSCCIPQLTQPPILA